MIDLTSAVGDDLHTALRAAAASGPIVTLAPVGATAVLRYDDIEKLAHDPRLAGVGLTFFDFMGITDGSLREWYGSLMFTNEGEYHDRLRKLVSRAFTPRSVEALRREAAALGDEAVAKALDEPDGDLSETFALVAMKVMCRLLGVPDADVPVFGAWADALSPIFGFMDPDQIAAATRAIDSLLAYVRELADRRRSDPADDLITRLLEAEDEGDKLTHDELVTMVANLLVGGHDTTTGQIRCSVLTLLRNPEEAARVRDDPALVQSATEETIRYEPSISAVPRTTVAPVTVAGTDLPAGSMVVLVTAAANRQPDVWAEPDRFDVSRFTVKGGPRLLSFGAGPHFCLGAALARVTVQEAVRATAARIDEIKLAIDPHRVPWRMILGRSPATLPVVAA